MVMIRGGANPWTIKIKPPHTRRFGAGTDLSLELLSVIASLFFSLKSYFTSAPLQ